MNLDLKKSEYKNKSIPFSLSTGIKKSKIKIDNLSPKINNKKYEMNNKEIEIYNYELELSSENYNIKNKKIQSNSKLENNKKIEKNNDDNFINQLIQLKMNNNSIFKNNVNEKGNYIKVFEKASNSNLNKDKKIIYKNKTDLIQEYSKLLSENKKIKKSIILQQILVDEMKKDLENLKLEKNKSVNEQIEFDKNNLNGDNNYQNILKEKNNLILELKNKNTKLTSENQILQEKLNKINKEKVDYNFIDNIYENILQISIDMENINKKNNTSFNNEFFKHINFDDNGNFSITDKINNINKCIDFIKREVKNVINNQKEDKNDERKINNYEYIDKKFDDLYNYENGLNNNELKKNNLDSKIKSNNFKYNEKLNKYNNRYILSNSDLNMNENLDNKIGLMQNNTRFNLKKYFLEKNDVIYKSNLISNSNNSLNDSRENMKTELNSEVKELTQLINNNKKNNLISAQTKLLKRGKKFKIPFPKFSINKTFNSVSYNNLKENNIKKYENIASNINLSKNYKTKKKLILNYSSNVPNNAKKKDENNDSIFEHIKTDININNKSNKYDFEYIKLNSLFKNLNNSSILSKDIKNMETSSRNKETKNKRFINNLSGAKKIGNVPKFLKIKNINEVNGLANEVMKPSFLKTDLSLSVNNNDEKDFDNFIFKDIKKYEILKRNKNN